MAKNMPSTTPAVAASSTTDGILSSQTATEYSQRNATIRNETASVGPNVTEEIRYQLEIEGTVQHICNLTLDNDLFLAPLPALERALDVGAGRGFWATEMAQRNPGAEITAFDLLPAPAGTRPRNLRLRTHDCCDDWSYPADYFDLVHIRDLSGCIADWPAVYRRAMKHLRPGGFVEHLEWSNHVRSADGKLSTNSTFAQWSQTIVHAGRLLGKTYEIAENMSGLIREVGFVEVVEKRYKWPIGPWAGDERMKEVGQLTLVNWQRALEAWARSVSDEHPEVCPSSWNRD